MTSKKIIIFLLSIWILTLSVASFIVSYNKAAALEYELPALRQAIRLLYNKNTYHLTNCIEYQEPDSYIYSGNYIPALAGNYQIEFYLKGGGYIIADVTSWQGTRALQARQIELDNDFESPLIFDYSLDNLIKDMEPRVKVLSGKNVCIEKIIISRRSVNFNRNLRTVYIYFKKFLFSKIPWKY